MNEIKGSYSPGKISRNLDKKGARNCQVVVNWELRDGEFTASGDVWNHIKSDVIVGGQCLDTLQELFPYDKKLKRIVSVWKKWHLNHMRAGCEHQRAQNWVDRRIDPKELPESALKQNSDNRGVLAIWVYRKEHKDGLLDTPCPECGYKYGSAWLKEPLPDSVISEIKSW